MFNIIRLCNLKALVKQHLRMYHTYNKASAVFSEPVLLSWHGKWVKSPTPPMSKIKNIVLFRKGTYYIREAQQVKIKKGCYSLSRHKLPNGLSSYQLMFKSSIRRKLRKWGLGWLQPTYRLPNWLVFDWSSMDIGWKWKWDDIRFEYKPFCALTLFGYTFAWWLNAPVPEKYKKDKYLLEEGYWEAILYYLHGDNCKGDINKVADEVNFWIDLHNVATFSLCPFFLKDPTPAINKFNELQNKYPKYKFVKYEET